MYNIIYHLITPKSYKTHKAQSVLNFEWKQNLAHTGNDKGMSYILYFILASYTLRSLVLSPFQNALEPKCKVLVGEHDKSIYSDSTVVCFKQEHRSVSFNVLFFLNLYQNLAVLLKTLYLM